MDEDKNRLNSAENAPKPENQTDSDDVVATNFDGAQSRVGETQSRRDEEFANEMTADDDVKVPADSDEDGREVNSAFGWIALALSIISYFVMPIILAGAGIIMGFVSRNRGADTLGNTAIIAGAISILITLFILPYV
ncbi:hypothetical protein [Lentibacillus amyloliquefaciens]|uniref:DUF4190 domain-containing protein n=1 Tax=Lentibacillus amyloliquefaciens TaxID=1472767 RepID=A0A0U4FCI2_9BACI|nr:hypothetical protein [Lentibacillus amyloliquefaciens]ALX50547.1 hypothetical protein AOX59_05485 [Lentibacillus amyloliquefaciens]